MGGSTIRTLPPPTTTTTPWRETSPSGGTGTAAFPPPKETSPASRTAETTAPPPWDSARLPESGADSPDSPASRPLWVPSDNPDALLPQRPRRGNRWRPSPVPPETPPTGIRGEAAYGKRGQGRRRKKWSPANRSRRHPARRYPPRIPLQTRRNPEKDRTLRADRARKPVLRGKRASSGSPLRLLAPGRAQRTATPEQQARKPPWPHNARAQALPRAGKRDRKRQSDPYGINVSVRYPYNATVFCP